MLRYHVSHDVERKLSERAVAYVARVIIRNCSTILYTHIGTRSQEGRRSRSEHKFTRDVIGMIVIGQIKRKKS